MRVCWDTNPSEVDEFIEALRNTATIAPGAVVVDAVPDDPKDNHVLVAAVETQCEFVVSGDTDLISIGSFQGVTIVSPRDLLTLLEALEQGE